MPWPLKVALYLHLVSLWTKEAIPQTTAYLPLGGSSFTEFSILVVAAIVVIEGSELVAKIARWWRERGHDTLE